MPASFTDSFPNGISSGDVTQTSAVVWARIVETGRATFQVSTDSSFHHKVKTEKVTVTDPLEPVKVEFDHLKPGEQYYYRVIDPSGDVLEGTFETSAKLGAHEGLHFGLISDWRAELAPFVSIKNAATADLDLVVKLGDTVYADQPLPPANPASTLEEFRLAHNEVYSSNQGFNFLADIQATTSILSMIDDHEVIDDFGGGGQPSSDPRFAGQPGDFINETPLYANGLQAFSEYNAIEDRTYSGTGEDRFDGAPDLYRYNNYGSDAAFITVDARSFRDAELAFLDDVPLPFPNIQFFMDSFDPTRTMLGDVQLNQLKQDLLDARDHGITWKFIMLPEPIQNFGPIVRPGDRYEGYAAERNELLKFIDQNHIENVVFVTSDIHWLSVNNLTYQESFGGPQIATSAIDITAMAVASPGFGPLVPPFAAQLGLITPEQLAFYDTLPNAPDTDNLLNDKDDFVELILDQAMTALGYDPIGLDNNLAGADGKINAQLLQGDYFVGHDYGWSDFNVDATTGELLVTTYGVPAYDATDLANDPAAILALNPTIVSQFKLSPTSDSIIGTAHRDHLLGTGDADVILGAAGNDVLAGRDGDDYLDGGDGRDVVWGGDGSDHIFGRDGNDWLWGRAGDDLIDGGNGNDKLNGGSGADILTGGLGGDRLTGGMDSDIFPFDLDGKLDRVTDFEDDIDQIRLDGITFDDLTIQNRFGGVLISHDGDRMLLSGLDAAQITTDDFFVNS